MSEFPSWTEHHKRVRRMRCVVTSRPRVTLHHCHGGSMRGRVASPGMSQRQSHALVIPLHFEYHVGRFGIDAGYGVQSWERDFGAQADYLDRVSDFVGYDVWEFAEWLKTN